MKRALWLFSGLPIAGLTILAVDPSGADDFSKSQSYAGTVTYTASSRGQSVMLTGRVDWTDAGPGSNLLAKTFTASGRLVATIALEGCDSFHGDVNVGGELYLNVPDDGRYSFALGVPGEDAVLSCNGVKLPYPILFKSPPCDGSVENAPRLGDGGLLEGSDGCAKGTTLKWRFKRNS